MIESKTRARTLINVIGMPSLLAIIYYGGNAEEVSQNLHDLKKFGDYSMLFVNYRGYGKSEGWPGQDVLFSDALFIFDHITNNYNIEPSNIFLMGRSLGSAVAVHVGSKRSVKGMILVTPFDQMLTTRHCFCSEHKSS